MDRRWPEWWIIENLFRGGTMVTSVARGLLLTTSLVVLMCCSCEAETCASKSSSLAPVCLSRSAHASRIFNACATKALHAIRAHHVLAPFAKSCANNMTTLSDQPPNLFFRLSPHPKEQHRLLDGSEAGHALHQATSRLRGSDRAGGSLRHGVLET